ncbi:DNA (cytosine-5-)-methyltransferase [Mycoplasmoides alvi]|uniref:DNA (cytosine-5-)-methyltransferase n=1 Tax=Mycoplasmoides alvi TaxID=78580 RepID=UPI00069871AC|nr:DNA (cytosine-5-)-methyltransferase [Mycoplasmoides alvi]
MQCSKQINTQKKIKFIDFCSGIGAGRIALEQNDMICVGHSEISERANEVYFYLHNDKNNFGDITKIDPKKLPDFDLMIAGFPCQSFSIVGKRKGLNDNRGKIIFNLVEILKIKKPKYFIFENVKGLVNHDKGKTIQKILNVLKKVGYNVEYKILNSLDYKIPQYRERVYFVGKQKNISSPILWPKKIKKDKLSKYLIETNPKYVLQINETFQKYLNNEFNGNKFNLNDILNQEYIVLDTRQSDLRIYEDRIPTLRHGRHGILYVKNGKLRKLSPKEAFLLQGFSLKEIKKIPKNFNENSLLSLIGNAMTISVVNSIARVNF